MAETLPQTLNRQIQGFTALPMPRQLGLLAGMAAVVALAATLASWALRPSYQVLLPGLGEQDKAAAMTALTQAGIPHRLEPDSGLLTVPGTEIHQARLQLATEGLPRADGVGFELMERDTGIGTSRVVESARYQRALEGELARSVTTLNSVRSARVHLALPRRTVFVRDRVSPSASVLVDLHPGRTLEDVQIAGIVHLVASSVPELEPARVTVVDQRGRLLSQPDDVDGSGQPVRQLEYTRRVEESVRQRVRDILTPVVGEDGLRVQVAAEVDFTQVESTRELFDPDNRALRSEQIAEEQRFAGATGGVPGALSNQPPGAAVVATPATPAAGGEGGVAAAAAEPLNRNNRSTRNYEVDRTIEHVRQAPASLTRLSVAVVVDDREVVNADGARVREQRDPAEIEYLSELVREAIGFNEARGDRVTLVNASFRELEAPEELPALPIWEQAWFLPLVKQGLAAAGVLLLIFVVLRPTLKRLAEVPPGAPRLAGAGAPVAGELQNDMVRIGAPSPEERLGQVRSLAKEDPRVVAQVVRQWMGDDE